MQATWATPRWVDSHEVRPGDVVYSIDEEHRRIDRVQHWTALEQRVCNLSVEESHTFAVGMQGTLVHNESWCAILLNKTKRDKPSALKKVVETNNWDMSRIHGHHIVMKLGGGDDARLSRELLAKFDVPLLATKDEFRKATNTSNLCYALNGHDGIHSAVYQREVYRRISSVVNPRASAEANSLAISEALRTMAKDLELGVKFW